MRKEKRPAHRTEDKAARKEAERLRDLFRNYPGQEAQICIAEMLKVCADGEKSELLKVKLILEKGL